MKRTGNAFGSPSWEPHFRCVGFVPCGIVLNCGSGVTIGSPGVMFVSIALNEIRRLRLGEVLSALHSDPLGLIKRVDRW